MRNGLYELVIAPEDYPGKKYRGRYIYEHHLVWWQNTGEVVIEPMLIHHKDDNKRHNAFSNLEKKSRSLHSSDHGKLRMKPPVEVQCSWCKRLFNGRGKEIKFRRLRYANLHCSRSCSVKHQWALGKGRGGRKKKVCIPA